MSSNRYLRIPGKRFVITKRIIEDAISNTNSNAEAARWMGVTYNTYKKWSKFYGLFEKNLNQSGTGISRKRVNTKYNLEDILDGKHPNYPKSVLKKRLIDNGYVENECTLCKWNEERITDSKICLKLDFIDGDESNYFFDNLRLLCPNCYFTNVGNFKNSKNFCQ
tara:strand:- start:549 stop:1043 length:495 start_codon:yes stop_codon:yes gene_type:complete